MKKAPKRVKGLNIGTSLNIKLVIFWILFKKLSIKSDCSTTHGGFMSLLNRSIEKLKFDKRLLDLNLRLGLLTQTEYDQHVKSLEDLEANSEKLDLESGKGHSEAN